MEILIISGLSGGGKSRAASFLEDIGYYTVDNLPAEMMMKFAGFCAASSGRYDRVVRMIEESEKLKSTAEDKASRMADRLVPYTLGGTALTYLLTRNVTKMLAVLMVDFSCALKLAIPIAVLSAMRECSGHHISVKGGRFMEAVAQADTIVFDKTGTLTQNKMTVVDHTGDTALLASAMALCSDAVLNPDGSVQGEPTEAALVSFAAEHQLPKPQLEQERPRIGEAPFDSGRKMMSTIHRTPQGVVQYTKGAPDQVLARCTHYWEGGQALPMTCLLYTSDAADD